MKKAFKYILIGLLVALGIYVLVSFIVNKAGTLYWINYIWDLLNKPLPVVGITSVALFVFIWQVVVFVRKNQPQKELIELRQEYNDYKQESERAKQELKEQNEKYLNFLYDICELSTNQKIKNYGKEHLGYGKDTNSETKAD